MSKRAKLTETIRVRSEKELKNRVETIARTRRLSTGNLARHVLWDFVDEEKTKAAAASPTTITELLRQ